jgi:formylglycine-generating enzyme required for sulfatase activity
MDPVRTVRIFLSSPGDVAAERAQARDLLLGLARGAFVRGRVHIDVVSWDDPHGRATMDARLTPQQAVDRSLPTPAECDLTVVLLWGRMGTPLTETKADGTPYLSGTEWEFENALTANKPVLVYRCTEKVSLDADDPDVDEKLTQKRRVDAFFKRFKGGGGTLLRGYSTYGSTDDLLKQLRADLERHLSERLREVDGSAPSGERIRDGRSAAIASGPPEVPVAYREWVKKQHGGVDLLGLQLKKGRPPSLSAIYVPQTTTASLKGRRGRHRSRSDVDMARGERERPTLAMSLKGRRGRDRRSDVDVASGEGEGPTLAMSRLATESLYVFGAPGTGKSIFCRWVAWLVAEGAFPSLNLPPPDEFAEVLDDGLKGRLPVLLRLREFWEYLPPRLGARVTVSDLEDAVAAWIEKRRPDGLDATLFRAHLAHGSALLLLDGMDEVPVSARSVAAKWLPRQHLLSALADACPTWTKAGNRLLLTSRPYGVSAEQAVNTTLRLAPLQPLPDALQSLLAQRWFAVLSADLQAGCDTAAELFANIQSQPWLVELAANPLLLTAMCIVFDEGKRLPQDKHELYDRVVATTLYSRYQDPADIDRVKRELGVIAYGMHTGTGPADSRTTPAAEATFHEVERWLHRYQRQKGYTERSEASVFDTRENLLSQSGLFISMGEDRAGFAHLSFQEFFAAQRAFTVNEERLPEVFLERAEAPEWRNTLSFLFARLLSAFSEPKKALDLLETLIEGASEGSPGLRLVLADAAQVLTGKGIALRPDLYRRLQDLLLAVMTGPAVVVTRAAAGSALAQLGDLRFRADRFWLPDEELLGFIRVEAGAFTMGTNPRMDPDAAYVGQPRHRVELPKYYIARYPVTVAQFEAFVVDSGFKPPYADSIRGIPNHPVVFVSFVDALAYCEWLTDKLKGAEWTPSLLREHLARTWAIMLPTEAEWEKAARGRDGRVYPWGNEFDPSKANVEATGLGTTSPVGMFPEGAAPCGALDMSGNVWEWTRSFWGDGATTTEDGNPFDPMDVNRQTIQAPDSVQRVVRGGSFDSTRLLLSPSLRSSGSPRYHLPQYGFRLVLSRLLP